MYVRVQKQYVKLDDIQPEEDSSCLYLFDAIDPPCSSIRPLNSSTGFDAPQDPPSHSRTGFSCLIRSELVSVAPRNFIFHVFPLLCSPSRWIKARYAESSASIFASPQCYLNGLQFGIFRKRLLSFIRKKRSRGKMPSVSSEIVVCELYANQRYILSILFFLFPLSLYISRFILLKTIFLFHIYNLEVYVYV